MAIPYARRYTATVTGAAIKDVKCEQCGAEYVYRVERDGEDSGTSVLFLDNQGATDRAVAGAEEDLRKRLERAVDLVPCPDCGWYQARMVAKGKRQYKESLMYVGIGVLVFAGFAGFVGAVVNGSNVSNPKIPWAVYAAVMALIVGIGIGFIVAKIRASRRYDPNDEDVEVRKQFGRTRAMLQAEFEKQLTATQPDAGGEVQDEIRQHREQARPLELTAPEGWTAKDPSPDVPKNEGPREE